jgi:pimeloyl-ACP methyl ester carboxylesterase
MAELAGCTAVISPLAQGWTERAVMLGSDVAALHGTLALPDGTAPVPGVLIIPGSGPVDRDGNLPGMVNNSLKQLAHGLAACGVASVRIDKRGIGASRTAGLHEEDLRFGTYIGDAIAWLGLLHAEPRISQTFLLGHSEGALVATLAAQRMTVAGLIIIAGAGEPAGKIIERQLADAGVFGTLQEASRRILTALESGETVYDVPAELSAIFRPSVQPYLSSWLQLDPAAELARLQLPVMIVQVTAENARLLSIAYPGAQLVLIEGMNHVLKEVPIQRAANLASYADPGLPLSPELIRQVTSFLNC